MSNSNGRSTITGLKSYIESNLDVFDFAIFEQDMQQLSTQAKEGQRERVTLDMMMSLISAMNNAGRSLKVFKIKWGTYNGCI